MAASSPDRFPPLEAFNSVSTTFPRRWTSRTIFCSSSAAAACTAAMFSSRRSTSACRPLSCSSFADDSLLACCTCVSMLCRRLSRSAESACALLRRDSRVENSPALPSEALSAASSSPRSLFSSCSCSRAFSTAAFWEAASPLRSVSASVSALADSLRSASVWSRISSFAAFISASSSCAFWRSMLSRASSLSACATRSFSSLESFSKRSPCASRSRAFSSALYSMRSMILSISAIFFSASSRSAASSASARSASSRSACSSRTVVRRSSTTAFIRSSSPLFSRRPRAISSSFARKLASAASRACARCAAMARSPSSCSSSTALLPRAASSSVRLLSRRDSISPMRARESRMVWRRAELAICSSSLLVDSRPPTRTDSGTSPAPPPGTSSPRLAAENSSRHHPEAMPLSCFATAAPAASAARKSDRVMQWVLFMRPLFHGCAPKETVSAYRQRSSSASILAETSSMEPMPSIRETRLRSS